MGHRTCRRIWLTLLCVLGGSGFGAGDSGPLIAWKEDLRGAKEACEFFGICAGRIEKVAGVTTLDDSARLAFIEIVERMSLQALPKTYTLNCARDETKVLDSVELMIGNLLGSDAAWKEKGPIVAAARKLGRWATARLAELQRAGADAAKEMEAFRPANDIGDSPPIPTSLQEKRDAIGLHIYRSETFETSIRFRIVQNIAGALRMKSQLDLAKALDELELKDDERDAVLEVWKRAPR